MAYGDTYTYDIQAVEDAIKIIMERPMCYDSYRDILNVVRGIGYREGKLAEKKRLIELLKLE